MTSPRRGTPLVLGHRGAAAQAPENTLPALELALRLGADGVEVDVQRSADGVLVLVHDTDWLRTAGLARRVREVPWGEVRRLDAGAWFGSRFRGVAPPRLEAALESLPDSTFVDLEIKSPEDDPGLGAAVLAAALPHAERLRFLLTSFDRDCLEALLPRASGIALGLLAKALPDPGGPLLHQALWAPALLEKPDHVERVHRAGGQVFAWTVDDPEVAQRLQDLGVEGIITNEPGKICKSLRRRDAI
ncbi:MAG TPA: glycerophosphodiester phosphodiesterase [Candidatus Krumholzibacteria bacterium]|nr:glycerophosphodiester phosphodiesterase [Candidatus Krumholzibacteria bacterium]